MSLLHSEQEAAAVAVAPRVSLDDILGQIAEEYYVLGHEAVGEPLKVYPNGTVHPLGLLTICILVMKNGFTVIGKSAPASPENFNAELGRKFAHEDCVRQLWPLMGFALRDRLSAQKGEK